MSHEVFTAENSLFTFIGFYDLHLCPPRPPTKSTATEMHIFCNVPFYPQVEEERENKSLLMRPGDNDKLVMFAFAVKINEVF